jgi:hypothetical protein
MSIIDPHADTVPCPDAPCDEPGCEKPWTMTVKVNEDTLYLCADHAESERGKN